jgi:pimeloyl-ACP methyl ester carboxylesterase
VLHADRMTPVLHRVSAWDGLTLVVREWPGTGQRRPLLCLPGLARTGADFAGLAETLGGEHRIIAPSYAGHGQSGRPRSVQRYAAEACVRDVLDLSAALHVHDAIGIGTSFGGLLCMGIAAARPSLLRAVVLNDIGPEIAASGAGFIRRFVGEDPALPDLAACAAYLRRLLPFLSLRRDEEWQAMARLTYAPGKDGRWHPQWDTRIARLLDMPRPDLWPLFGALAHMPLLLLRGETSELLLEDTVTRMRTALPAMQVTSVPGVGHAPTLLESSVVGPLRDFLERAG